MIPEKTQALVDLFPSLYPKNFYFECNDGWFKLLLELSMQLEAEIESQDSPNELEFKATQVKEKYGTLRFYMNFLTDKMQDLIDDAEKKSRHICENCGSDGLLMLYHGWWKTSYVECRLAKARCSTCETP